MALTVSNNVERFKLNPSGPAIGIDLGTTNSRVGYFINNNVEIITTASGEKTVPSYVFYNGKEECMVGEPAVAQWKVYPKRVAYDSKRLIGLNYNDNVVNRNKSFWTFTVTKSDNNRPIYDIDKNHQVLPEEVSSEILKELIKMAQDKIGTEKIESAVITVPDHFLVRQKEATLHAAKLAGIEHVKLITESTAAAFAYGFDHKRFHGYNLFVFDLGGGTCDVSIVKVKKGEFKVIGHAGDTQLGGRDYDYRLMQYFVQKHKDLRVFESTDEIITKRKMRLREACEALKIALSHPSKASETIHLDEVATGLPKKNLTCKQFKEIVADLTRRCRKLCFDALEETQLTSDNIHEVLLVGGSSKMRVIKDMLKGIFPTKELSEAINPDEVLAYGTTLRAAQLLDPEKSKGSGRAEELKAILEIKHEANGFFTTVARGGGKEVTKQVNYEEQIMQKAANLFSSHIKILASVDENVNLENFINRHYGHGTSAFQQTMNNIVLVTFNCWNIPFLINAFQTYYTFADFFANKSSLELNKYLTSENMTKNFDTQKTPDLKNLKMPEGLTIYELKHEDKSLAINVIDLFEFSITSKSIPPIIKWIRKIKEVDAICLVISISNLSNFKDEIIDSLSGISTIDLGKTVIFIIHKTYDLKYITRVTLSIHDVVAEYYKKRNAVLKKGFDNIFVFNNEACEHLLKEQENFKEISKVLQESWYQCVAEFRRFLSMPVFKQKKFIIVEE